uniref:(California timema) hypothetical protein n=1 Tax=Timema californicum TaxID=61474 RepID=A0A7R9JCK9_TIMCA|nr:unnamed protein product [Timema californicum]
MVDRAHTCITLRADMAPGGTMLGTTALGGHQAHNRLDQGYYGGNIVFSLPCLHSVTPSEETKVIIKDILSSLFFGRTQRQPLRELKVLWRIYCLLSSLAALSDNLCGNCRYYGGNIVFSLPWLHSATASEGTAGIMEEILSSLFLGCTQRQPLRELQEGVGRRRNLSTPSRDSSTDITIPRKQDKTYFKLSLRAHRCMRKQDEVQVLEDTIRQRSEQHKKAGVELDATCHICLKTKFADGVGHICNYCNIRCCARCGGKVTLRSNKAPGNETPATTFETLMLLTEPEMQDDFTPYNLAM